MLNKQFRFLTLLVLTSTIVMAFVSPANAAGLIETMPLWRAQVRITTGSTATAGTNGIPAVRLNGSSSGVRWLNPPSPTAFDAGRIDTYDLRLLATPSEITMLRIGVAGNDDWCIKKVELLLNGRLAFAHNPVPGNGCASITGGTYVEYSSAALRSNPAWSNYGAPPSLPTGLSAPSLTAIATGVTGSAMRSDTNVGWDMTRPLTVARKTPSSVTVAFGIWIHDPSGIETSFRVRLTYDVQLFVGVDGRLHAFKTNASCCYHYGMSDAVVDHLNTALSRTTDVPVPHAPLRFDVDALSNITWRYAPVVG